MEMRPMVPTDVPAFEAALEGDKFHPGEWTLEHFADPQVMSSVVEDKKGPVVFVRFSKVLRISTVWSDPENNGRNARAIVAGMKSAIHEAIKSGYKEIIVTTEHAPLAEFLKKFGFNQQGTEYLLSLT